MAKDPPSKGKPPSGRPPTETPDVTTSQILSTRDLEPSPPPASPRSSRRSTTHGVGWYATEDGEDLAQPAPGRRGKVIFVAALLTVLVGGLAGAYLWARTHQASPPAAPVAAPDAAPEAAPPAPDAAPVRLARLRLSSTPPGAELVVDGRPVGKAPVEIEVPESSTVVVEATLAEHEPWREEVRVAPAGSKVVALLVPIPADAGPPADAAVLAPVASPEKKVSRAPAKKKTTKKKAVSTKKKKRTTRK